MRDKKTGLVDDLNDLKAFAEAMRPGELTVHVVLFVAAKVQEIDPPVFLFDSGGTLMIQYENDFQFKNMGFAGGAACCGGT